MFKNLLKAAVGVVIETPIAILSDVATMGGAVTGREEPATVSALKRVAENVKKATDADED